VSSERSDSPRELDARKRLGNMLAGVEHCTAAGERIRRRW